MATPDLPAAKRAGLPVDVGRLAREGDAWLSPEERYALKTHGVCAQLQPGVFMVRVRIAGGRISAAQANGLAALAERYGQSWLHVSTRQNLELHNVKAFDVPTVVNEVSRLGLTTRSACGHTLRNVMACPDAGVGLDEPFDCNADAVAVSDALIARSAELNCVLPSRLNLAFGGCPVCSEHARLNDLGFVSVIEDGVAGYRLWAGGSLGTAPFLAIPVCSFIPRRHAVAAAVALVNVFVEHGDLDNPKKGRLKYVVETMGEDAFRRAFIAQFDTEREATTYEPEASPVIDTATIGEILRHLPDGGWSTAVRPQRTPGLAMVTVNVPLGDLVGDELVALASLAAVGDGCLYTTRNQNLMFRDVPVAKVALLREGIEDIGLSFAGADTAADVRACTGSAVCGLAITAAPVAGRRLLESRGLNRNAPLRVHVSGCPNSCAQHQAGDIGLAGAKVRINGKTRLGYTVFVGADIAQGRLAESVGRVAEDDVEEVVDGLIGAWEVLRHPGEPVADTVARVGHDAFAACVASIASGFEPGPDETSPAPPEHSSTTVTAASRV